MGTYVMHSFIPALVRTFALLSIVCASAAGAQDNSWTLQPDARIEVQTISAQTTTRDDDLVAALVEMIMPFFERGARLDDTP